MMTVRLIAHTPEPEKVVAAAAKLCYSDAHITDLLDGLTEEKTAKFLTMLSVLLFAAVTVELMTVVILSGDSLLLRQSFLMGCLIDLLAIMACTEGLHRLKIIETDGQ